MAPFNLENNIREKLENRELKPSPDAWKKLESQLDRKQPKRKSTTWYYIAASIVGLLIAVPVFINQNTSEVENSFVVENDQPKDVIQKETETFQESNNPSEVGNVSKKMKTENEPKQKKELKPVPVQKESEIDKKIKKSEALATSQEIRNSIDSEKPVQDPNIEENEIFNAKVDEVVASIKTLHKENKEVTAEEVETLLNNARRDIQTQRILNSPKISASELLEEVEWELEKSFRDKVFDAFGDGFQKLKTAISQRND